MAEFRFITTGNMTIELQGLSFGRHIRDPKRNVKSFITDSDHIVLNAENQSNYTDWGIIELFDESKEEDGCIVITIDSPNMGWFGTAQIALYVNGQNILNDNFQSGVRDPISDPRRVKTFPVGKIG